MTPELTPGIGPSEVAADMDLPLPPLPDHLPADVEVDGLDGASVARATGVVALGNIASRLLGLGREMLLSDLFGAGVAVDAFNIAIIVPRTLYDLLIGGHVNSALVPVLSEYAMRNDRTALWRLVNLLLGLVILLLAGLVLLLELFAPPIVALITGVDLLAPALRLLPSTVPVTVASTPDLAVQLLRITTPALMFLSLFAVLSGLLYALRRFSLPAFAGAAFNGSIVIVTILAAPSLGIAAMAVGWLVGAGVQMGVQLLALRDARLWPALRGLWQEPGIRRIIALYVPVMFSLIVDTLIIRLVSYRLAAQAGEASISYMNYATTLIQFPHGLVATAISIAILPTLSRQAVQLSSSGVDVYKNTLGRGLRLAIVLIIPAAIGLFVLATEVVGLIFGHGEFTTFDTGVTSLALRVYLFGLPFAAVDLLLVFAFYSQQDTLTPALIGVISLVAYMAVALGLMPQYGLFSLMIADSLKHLLHAAIAGWLLSKRIGGLRGQNLPLTTLKTGGAALVMGLVALLTQSIIAGIVLTGSLVGELLVVIGAAVAGAATFFLLAAVLHIDELYWLYGLLRARLMRG